MTVKPDPEAIREAVEDLGGWDFVAARCGYCDAALTPDELRTLGTGTADDHWPCRRIIARGVGGTVHEPLPPAVACAGMGV